MSSLIFRGIRMGHRIRDVLESGLPNSVWIGNAGRANRPYLGPNEKYRRMTCSGGHMSSRSNASQNDNVECRGALL